MRRWPASLVLLLSVVGIALVADAVVEGGATLSLVLIVPVVTGSSPELLAGVGLTFAGVLGWAVLSTAGPTDDPVPPVGPTPRGAGPGVGNEAMGGGVVLIGPVPIFLGGYRPGSVRAWWAWVAAGFAVTVGIWLALAAFVYFR